MTLNLYMGEIKGEVSDIKKNIDNIKNGKIAESTLTNLSEKEKKIYSNDPPTVEERAAQVAVHETEHAINPNAQMRNGTTREQAEKVATAAEIKAIDEINQKKK